MSDDNHNITEFPRHDELTSKIFRAINLKDLKSDVTALTALREVTALVLSARCPNCRLRFAASVLKVAEEMAAIRASFEDDHLKCHCQPD